MAETGYAVQVVTVVDENTYHLNTKKLEEILLRNEIKDMPVAVVSVAGAFRGGKSFLLNFFLKYLKSTPAARADGSWLDKDSNPLTGFSWRGGSERNTVGILMWSEPLVIELQTGAKVVVFLMDTQGTFDHTSTIRDCSTIFALSTLLSSTQIYNLSSNIKEDDLQNLQLFTDYAKLLKDQSEKAFQVLGFLVRDWMNDHEFAYGENGGRLYLEKVFDTNRKQPKESKELRQHILASFDKVTCFLMPHPGLNVSEPVFNGSTGEIGSTFQVALKELTTSLFHKDKITMKLIGGQQVKSQELYSYFKTCMSIFNSNTLPTPMTILKATSEAGLMIACNNAREQFETNMQKTCGVKAPCLPVQEVIDLHKKEVAAARYSFKARKLFGDQKDIDNKLMILTKELTNRLTDYLEINHSKTMKAKLKGFEAYDLAVEGVCVHPKDLKIVHKKGIAAATTAFDKNRIVIGAVDKDKDQFITELEAKYSILEIMNTQKNNTNIDELKAEYFQSMMTLCNRDPKPSKNEIDMEHKKAFTRALGQFESKRNFPNKYKEDPFKSNLQQAILSQFKFMKPINASVNKRSFQKGLLVYNNNLVSVSEIRRRCLHPIELEKQHKEASRKAFQAYNNDTSQDDDSNDSNNTDNDKLLLESILRDRYDTMVDANTLANNNAVELGLYKFKKEFDRLTVTWYTQLFGMNQSRRRHWYGEALPAGVDEFYSKRLNRNYENDDIYLTRLKEQCKNHALLL